MAFRDIIGQKKAIDILLKTMGRGRMPSSYLFAGESGIGKKLTALNLAKFLNCQNPALKSGSAEEQKSELPDYQTSRLPDDCCDECSSCRRIESQTHPDFLLISPEKSEIRVDEIRIIEETLSFASYEGRTKVVIVDDAHVMNASAANAFLKTLEEPPQHSLIILVSSSPDRLSETIRSRCSRINFAPLSPEECGEVIKKYSGEQPADSVKLSVISQLSMGRPGLAISNDLIEDRDWFMRLFREIVTGGNKESWADKEEIEKWFNLVFALLRDIAVFKITGKADKLINMDIREDVVKLSKTCELKDIIECYVKISVLKGYLGFNLNKSITWNFTGSVLSKFRRGI